MEKEMFILAIIAYILGILASCFGFFFGIKYIRKNYKEIIEKLGYTFDFEELPNTLPDSITFTLTVQRSK